MSTGMELVPLALAVGAAVAAASRKSSATPAQSVLSLGTRMRDDALLREALETAGACYGDRDGTVYGSIEGTAVAFTRAAGGTFEAHFDASVAEDDGVRLVSGLDDEYARLVQGRAYERVVERAPDFGLEFESEELEGEDIVVTLRVPA